MRAPQPRCMPRAPAPIPTPNEERYGGCARRHAGPASDLLFDAGRFAREVAQVVKLRATHAASALHRDVADRRAVRLEHALHTLAVRDLAHRERGVEAAIALRDDDAFVRLHALAIALDHLHLHDDGIAGIEVRHLARHARLFDLLNDVVSHVRHLTRPYRRAPRAPREIRSVAGSPRR